VAETFEWKSESEILPSLENCGQRAQSQKQREEAQIYGSQFCQQPKDLLESAVVSKKVYLHNAS